MNSGQCCRCGCCWLGHRLRAGSFQYLARAHRVITLASHWFTAAILDCDWSSGSPQSLSCSPGLVALLLYSAAAAVPSMKGGEERAPVWLGPSLASAGPLCCSQSLHTIQPKTSCTAQLRPINLYSLSPQLKCTHRKLYLYRLFQGPFNLLISEIYSQLESFRNGGRNLRWRCQVSTGGDE